MAQTRTGAARRAFGELAVIIVGVLVALWIDAAYQAWQDRQAEQDALRSLSAELEETLRRLDEAIEVQEEVVAAHHELFQLGESQSLPSQDSLGLLVGRAFYFARLEPVRGTYDALIASGEITLLRDHELRDALARLFGFLGDGFEDEAMADMGRVQMGNAIAEVAAPIAMIGSQNRSIMGLPPIERPLPFREVLQSPSYLAALQTVAFPERGVLESYFQPLRRSLVDVLQRLGAPGQ